MAVVGTARGPSPGLDLEGYWKRKIISMLGSTPSSTHWFWHSFAMKSSSGVSTLAASGGARATATKGVTHTNGGGAGGIVVVGNDLASTIQATTVLTSATEKYIVAGRFSVNTAVAAGGVAGIGARSATGTTVGLTLCIGGVGSVSTTNFVVFGSTGTSFDTGMALDTSKHDFLIHRDGATTHAYIDGVLKASGDARPGADSGFVAAYATDSAANTISTTNVWSAFACLT